MSTGLIIGGIVLLLVILVVVLYNSLIRKKNNCHEAWSGISVQMKRRYDLIPNLVNTVKGYAKHESELFENVTKARTAAMGATSMKDHAQSENMLTGALKSLFAVAENYPDLKANQNFMQLQEELTDTEDKLQAARRFYNNAVKSLNTACESVPTNIIAGMFKFEKREFFELEEGEKEAAQKPVETKF
ncbi:MAG: LemA family protein [Nitrospirota bacterium]